VLGLIFAALALIITLVRQKKFKLSNLGAYALIYGAGSNLPVGPYLCYYGLFPDPALAQTNLHGAERYIAFAGFVYFLVTAYTVWSILKKAFKKPIPTDGQQEITPPSTFSP